MMRRDDLRRVAGSALLALSMVAAGSAAIWASGRLAAEVRQAHQRSTRSLDEARRALAAARSEEAEIAAKIDRYRHLVERGAVGTERRLAWVELMRDARERHGLGAVDYEFSPQRPVDARLAPADADRLEVASSALRLRLPLLHEGQLLTLLHDIAVNAPALVRVRECAIARRTAAATATATATAGEAEQLQADCQLDWITFRPRKDKDS